MRVRAYRQAAMKLMKLGSASVPMVACESRGALRHRLAAALGIDPAAAEVVAEIAQTGRSSLVERLRREAQPDQLFALIPGVGPRLARRLIECLGVTTLDTLTAAVEAGRLAEVPALTARRRALLRDAVAAMLARARAAAG